MFYLAWLCILVSWPSSLRAECPVTATGVCTPGVEETIVITETESIEYEADGHTVTTETTTTTTTTTVTSEDSGDVLDGDNGYVTSSKEGDMDIDWGGQGPASMPSGTGCGQLGTDKCAQITGSGNNTSTMGVTGMGTTFIQTVDISDLDIEYGGRTNYTIKVDKQDAQDRIYMHITGKNGTTNVFSGTDILSESGVATGYEAYAGGFDFSGKITTLIVEIGGRDINLAIGPLFDDVTVNILYNTINTIVTQSIESVEMFVALNVDATVEEITIVENIFEHNDIISSPDGDINIEPEFEEPDMEISYEIVEIEMEMELPTMEIEMPEMEMDMPEIEVASVESEIEMEMEMEMPEPEMKVEAEPTTEPEPEMEEPVNEPEPETKDESVDEPADEPKEEVAEEPEAEESSPEATEDEAEETEQESKEEEKSKEEEPKKEEIKKQQKEKAAKKIVKKMGDKGKYDSQNQMKTLIVMQVLGNSKTFFESQQQLNDREGFFTDMTLPDTVISDNNIAGYFLFAGSDGLMNEMVMQQWQK